MSSVNVVLSFQSYPSYYPPLETTHKLLWDLLPNSSSAIPPGLANDRGEGTMRNKRKDPLCSISVPREAFPCWNSGIPAPQGQRVSERGAGSPDTQFWIELNWTKPVQLFIGSTLKKCTSWHGRKSCGANLYHAIRTLWHMLMNEKGSLKPYPANCYLTTLFDRNSPNTWTDN